MPRGRQLITLQDAANFILKLPKAEQSLKEWQLATSCLIQAAEGRGPLMHARIGVLKGLLRDVEPVFDSSLPIRPSIWWLTISDSWAAPFARQTLSGPIWKA